MKEGSIVKGIVTSIKDYGAFIKVDDYDGLVHISEFSDGFVRDIHSIVNVGDEIELKVIEISRDNKLRLSYKAINKGKDHVYKYIHVKKGFSSLSEKLDDWINDEYKKIVNK